MKKLKLNTGDHIPSLGLGTWKSEPNIVGKTVETALKIGYRHIDCAHIYENESEIGNSFSKLFSSHISRDDVWITSKLWNDSHRGEDVMPALKTSLHRLKLDYLDLYLIHWAIAQRHGIESPQSPSDYLSLTEVPIIETWQAMEECVKDGLVENIGVSNFSVNKLTDLISKANIKPSVNQVEMHPLLAQNELKKYCDEQNIILTAYSPLGAPHREIKKDKEPELLGNKLIVEISENHKCSPAQVLIAWAIYRNTSVIPKSMSPKRLKENFESQNINLSDEEMSILNSLNQNYRFIDGRFFSDRSNYTLEDIWG